MKCSFVITPAQVGLNKDHQSISSSKCVRTFSSSWGYKLPLFRYCNIKNPTHHLDVTVEFVDCVIDVNAVIMVHCNL